MTKNIYASIEQHDLNRLAALLAAGVDPNETLEEWSAWPPLHAAIEEIEEGGSIEAVILLLRHGAAVDGQEAKRDLTPLLIALMQKQREAARILLAAGADPNLTGGEGDSPLRWSVEHDDLEMAALLLRCGADQTIDSAGGPSGMNALGRAANRLNIPMVKLLLAAGADPEALDNDYRTASQRMPLRGTDPQAWDAVMALLTQRPPSVGRT